MMWGKLPVCITAPRFELTSQRQKVSRLPTEPLGQPAWSETIHTWIAEDRAGKKSPSMSPLNLPLRAASLCTWCTPDFSRCFILGDLIGETRDGKLFNAAIKGAPEGFKPCRVKRVRRWRLKRESKEALFEEVATEYTLYFLFFSGATRGGIHLAWGSRVYARVACMSAFSRWQPFYGAKRATHIPCQEAGMAP